MDSEFHELFGYVGPAVRARRVVSLGTQDPTEDAELADLWAALDALAEHAEAVEAIEASATAPASSEALPDSEPGSGAEPSTPNAGGSRTAAGVAGTESAPDASSSPGSCPSIRGVRTDWAPEPDPPTNCPRPYSHLKADQTIRKLTKVMRELSSRSRWLVPDLSSWNPLGAGSIFSSRSISFVKEEDIKHIGKLRSRFPSNFTAEPTQANSLSVSPGEPRALPRWKDKGRPEKAARHVNEILLGVRVASLVAGGRPTRSDLGLVTDSPDVGFFSMRLPPHQAASFADIGTGSDVLARSLMRRLKARLPSALGVFAWRREVTGEITLFGALSNAAYGDASTYAAARSGLRFGRSLARAGVVESNFYDIEPETFAKLYDLPSESFAVRGWADRNAEDFADSHAEAVDPIEFDFVTKRFRTAQEIDAWYARSEGIWRDYVARCGLPEWFGTTFLDIFLDALVRTPEAAREHRHAEETNGKYRERPSKKELARAVMRGIEEVDAITLETLRFYRGSPAEFAALATSEGKLIGIYCPAELMKVGEDLYSDLRS